MGTVYRGVHEATGALAAVKTVNVGETGRISQIRREVQALARLKHPGVVRVLAHGLDAGMPWYAMELLEGRTLEQLHREGLHGSEHLTRALGLVHGLCETLAYVHGEGVIHRDLKPSNVFVLASGKPVLVDFGLATHLGDLDGRDIVDSDTHTVGSAWYISPEQIRGELLDPRCDLYALGCVLFELVTDQPPFVGSSHAVIDQHLRKRSPRVRDLVRDVPVELDRLIGVLLEKNRNDRIGHASDVAASLRASGATPIDWGEPLPNPRGYLYRPPLVGREEVLSELDQLQAQLAASRGSIAFLVGESGVGKTRLALESAQRASHSGARVIASGCHDMSAEGGRFDVGSRSGPLEPLRPFLRSVADACIEGGAAKAAALLGPSAIDLAAYEPTLASFITETREAPLPAPAALHRLYESLRSVLVAFAEMQPLMLIIDDLQWADELTLGFLQMLGPRLGQTPITILGLLRSEERSPEIDALLKAPWAKSFELSRLGPEALARMVAGMLSIAQPPLTFIDYLAKQSEGNPFFVAEYLRTAAAEQQLVRDARGQWQLAETAEPTALPLPRSLREIIERRVEGLDAIAREFLVLAGTIGRQFDLSVLQAAAAISDERGLDVLADLVQRQILEPVPGESGFRFTHDKLRQLTVGELPREARQALHRRVAEVLEARRLTGTEAELAAVGHHWLEADDAARAVEPLHRAGDLAVRVHALDRALAHYRRAFEALAAGAEPGGAAEIAEKLADVLALRGSFDEARAMFGRALESRLAIEALARARVRSKLGRTWEIAHAHENALAEYDLAELELRSEAAASSEVRRLRIQIQLSRVWVYYWCARTSDMTRVLEEIAPEVTQHGTALERTKYYSALAQRAFRVQRFAVDAEVVEHAARSLDAAKEAGAPVELAMAAFVLGFARVLHEDLEGAQSALGEALQAARRLGDSTSEIRCIAYLALTHRRADHLAACRDLALQAEQRATAANMREYVGLAKACLAWAAANDGDCAQAQELCREALQEWSRLNFPYPFQWTAGLLLLSLWSERALDADDKALVRRLCDRDSARLPEPIGSALEDAVAADAQGDEVRFEAGVRRAVAAAIELGYA